MTNQANHLMKIDGVEVNVLRQFESKGFRHYMLDHDLMYVEIVSNLLSEKEFSDLEELMKKEINGQPVWVISNLDHIVMVTRDGFIKANTKAENLIHGNVSIVRTKVAKMIVEFFMKIVRPDWPFGIVTNFEDARNWIEDQRIRRLTTEPAAAAEHI